MRSPGALLIFFLVLLLIDLYTFKGLRWLTADASRTLRNGVTWAFLGIHLLYYTAVILAIVRGNPSQSPTGSLYFQYLFGAFVLLYVPKLVFVVFHLLNDLQRAAIWGAEQIRGRFFTSPAEYQSPGISRAVFLSRVGLALAAIPLAGIVHGIFEGRYRHVVRKVKIKAPNIPAEFNGVRIAQISDLHLGSFLDNRSRVESAIRSINDLECDILVFTGDMVNNTADEAAPWTEVLGELRAPLGKFAVLGNHDYGDYYSWPSADEKAQNLDQLKTHIGAMGFKLLLNEHVKISRNSNEAIELIGVENWGLGGFSQYGKLSKALEGTNPENFQVLLSHDPSHWDGEVLSKSKIDLTLSGHTHGMQFGVEVPGLRWSPVQYRYPRWAGLYDENKRWLYVNRGFGYIGFPGRVGIFPEITVFTLEHDSNEANRLAVA